MLNRLHREGISRVCFLSRRVGLVRGSSSSGGGGGSDSVASLKGSLLVAPQKMIPSSSSVPNHQFHHSSHNTNINTNNNNNGLLDSSKTTTMNDSSSFSHLNYQHPWSSEDFKNHLRTTGEFITQYYEKLIHASSQAPLSEKDEHLVENSSPLPVCSQVQPGYLAKLLPSEAPLKGESFDDILKDISEKIMPGITHWQHPNFYSVCICLVTSSILIFNPSLSY